MIRHSTTINTQAHRQVAGSPNKRCVHPKRELMICLGWLRLFQRAGRQHSADSLDWLRRLHRSHSPQAGPFSTCMHRSDAAAGQLH
jgi:hypothetical protein